MQKNPLAHNIEAHDRIADTYELRHSEIFNTVEQQRLHEALARARTAARTGSHPLTALDYGCGSGNVTRHLLKLGCHVIAADVSARFLQKLQTVFQNNLAVTTLRMNGENLAQLPDSSVDLVAVYSVLHHILDYLDAVKEMMRVLKPGGVLYIDHEHSVSHWLDQPLYTEFVAKATQPKKRPLTRFLLPHTYVHKMRRMLNPRFEPEGDIHVFPDDHIEWDAITKLLLQSRCEVITKEDYLVYKSEYDRRVYDAYANRCTDMTLLIARKTTQ